MNSINIQVVGEELEVITVELTSEEVAKLYTLKKETAACIAALEKKLADEIKSKEYKSSEAEKYSAELSEANTLLTALGVPDKTSHEESYYRRELKVATRIALYIAGVKAKGE